ncbi:MAG TPA: M48 family metallopeptidase [Vicinamibacterales bacterium]|jgi:Zn-dependent protease with chaperone function|nr:M48 family metallopeptidase [Vicinamibacterales bacterium]
MANEDKATRYHRLKRRASVLGAATQAFLLVVLLVSGASIAMREAAVDIAGRSFVPVVIAYVVMLGVLLELVQLPWAFYSSMTLERRYGLSTQATAKWWIDHLKAGGVALAFSIAAALIVLALMRVSPERWWIYGAVAFTAILVLLAQLAPVILLPLFYDLKPLTRDALRDRLLVLAERAGARVLGVFEWRLSDRTKKANAALTGIGATRRILLSDTLLADHSDDEIEVILAHELAHHIHHDIWTGIALEAALIGLGFYLADGALARYGSSVGLVEKGDAAGLPLLVLAAGAVSLALMPVATAVSRAHERRADRYALTLTRNPSAFITAMKRLAAQNLAEERPSLIARVFSTHPSTAERIDAAKEWQM